MMKFTIFKTAIVVVNVVTRLFVLFIYMSQFSHSNPTPKMKSTIFKSVIVIVNIQKISVLPIYMSQFSHSKELFESVVEVTF